MYKFFLRTFNSISPGISIEYIPILATITSDAKLEAYDRVKNAANIELYSQSPKDEYCADLVKRFEDGTEIYVSGMPRIAFRIQQNVIVMTTRTIYNK